MTDEKGVAEWRDRSMARREYEIAGDCVVTNGCRFSYSVVIDEKYAVCGDAEIDRLAEILKRRVRERRDEAAHV